MRWSCKPRLTRLALAGAIALGLVAASPAPAAADLWETLVQGSVTPQQVQTYKGDRSGISVRGGLGLGLPASRGGQVLSLEAAGPRGCGATDFVAEFKGMFNAQALEDYFTGLLDTTIATAPLVLMCYASPTLCDAYKHFKSTASQVLQLRAGECRAVEQAALDLGDKMAKKQESACLERKIAEGKPSWQALDECKQESGASVLNYALQPVQNFNAVEEALTLAGADDEQKQFARALLGEASFRDSRWHTEVPGPGAAEGLWGEVYTGYVDRLAAILETVQAGGTPSQGDIQGVSVPGVPIGVPVFQRMAGLPAAERALATQKLAAALALARISYRLKVMEAQLRQPGSSPAGNQAQPLLEERVKALKEAAERFRALKANADGVAETIAAIDAAARTHEQRALGTTQPIFSVAPSPVAQPGRPARLQGGIELSP